MTITQIRCFVTVGETLNFTKAAEQLYISQQVVSRQIANLEKELDLTLLERTTKRVRLTKEGQILFDTWQQLLTASDAAIARATNLHARQQRRLRVGIADVNSLMGPVRRGIERFIEEYPEVELEYSIYTFRRLRDMLRGDEVDVILTLSTEVRDIVPIRMARLMDLRLSIILSKRHPLAGAEALSIKDLAGESLYFFSPAFSFDADQNLRGIFRKEGIPFENVTYFDSVRSLELALLAGRGITITFDIFLQENAENLIFHDITRHVPPEDQSAVAAWQDEQNKTIPKFIDCIKDQF